MPLEMTDKNGAVLYRNEKTIDGTELQETIEDLAQEWNYKTSETEVSAEDSPFRYDKKGLKLEPEKFHDKYIFGRGPFFISADEEKKYNQWVAFPLESSLDRKARNYLDELDKELNR